MSQDLSCPQAGVLAVLTGADYGADGIGDLGHVANPAGAEEWQTPAFVNRDGSVPFDAPQPPIVSDRIRHAGEIVAVVMPKQVLWRAMLSTLLPSIMKLCRS